jgi:hypothetical protein
MADTCKQQAVLVNYSSTGNGAAVEGGFDIVSEAETCSTQRLMRST